MKKIYFLYMAAIFVLLVASFAWADTIYLESGKIVTGNIVEESAKFVRIDIGDGVILRYYLDEIEKIEKKPLVKPKVFRLKPSPLLVPPTKGIPTTPEDPSLVGRPHKETITEEMPAIEGDEDCPSCRDKDAVAKTPGPGIEKARESSSYVPYDIRKIINTYLKLVSKPLPEDKSPKEQTLQELNKVLDLENMSSFSFFKEIMEEAQRANPKVVEERFGKGPIKDEFLKSIILGFQNRYLKNASAQTGDFRITGVDLSDNKEQATAWIEYKDNIFKIKLHKIGSKWSIYSTN